MRPVSRRDSGDKIGDTGTVLRNAHAMLPRDPRIAIRHVGRVLLMRNRYETYAGKRKKVMRVHVGGADDAKAVFYALRNQRFDKSFAGRHPDFAANGEILREILGICHRVHAIPLWIKVTRGPLLYPVPASREPV